MPDSPLPPVEVPEAERPSAHQPADRPKEPSVRAPVGACDAHVHMVAGPAEFPLSERGAEHPAPGRGFEDWLALYRTHLDTLGCTRGVIVQSKLYGTDNRVTIEALRRLGDGFRGVALVTEEVQDDTLDHLAGHGVRAVRLNLVHGSALGWDGARAIAPRLAERGMHVEMLLHADRHLPALADDLAAMPVPVVIDHAGWPTDGRADSDGIRTLLRLLGDGMAWIKLSAVYRFAPPPYDGADDLVRAMVAANPRRCLWGSDWPHLMLGDAPMPDAGVLFDAFTRAIEDPAKRQRILVDNPAAPYGF